MAEWDLPGCFRDQGRPAWRFMGGKPSGLLVLRSWHGWLAAQAEPSIAIFDWLRQECRLISASLIPDHWRMTSSLRPNAPVNLSPEQVEHLLTKLRDMRHDVTGRLSNIAAAAELIRARPTQIEDRLMILLQQPHLAAECITSFSRELEAMLGVNH